MEKFFKLKENGTTVSREIIAGLTTFFAMAYIIVVNPNTLSGRAGGLEEELMPWGAVFLATIIASIIGTLVMGLVANVPYAQAPGMGLNAFFVYTVCLGLGFTWQQTLSMVFICGLINILITVTKIRKFIIKSIPRSLQNAIGGGIGIFVAYIGFLNVGFVNFGSGVPAMATLNTPVLWLFLIGLAITIILLVLNVKGAILIGIVAGYLAAFIMGFVLPTTGVTAEGVEFTKAWVLNWSKVAQADWFAIPKLVPVKIVFDMRAILPVLIMFIVTAVETVGDISGVMEGGMSREATDKELSGGVICDGLGSSFAACFGVLPNTSFSQNVGLVSMTKVVNRGALATGAIFLILCGLIPKLGALVSIMPQAVLGGAAVMMFSSIVVSGIQLITKEKMTPRTLTIVSVALGVGYGMGANASILAHTPQFFQLICGESGIVPAAFVAIVLNVLLPKDDKAE